MTGRSVRVAADAFHIDHDIPDGLGHLFEKLGVTSRTEAVNVATRRGLVRLG